MFRFGRRLDLIEAIQMKQKDCTSGVNIIRLCCRTVLQVIRSDTEANPAGDEKQPGETEVSVQLFDSPPMNFSVPGDIPWTDPKFSEVVAQEALDRYKQSSM